MIESRKISKISLNEDDVEIKSIISSSTSNNQIITFQKTFNDNCK